MGIPYCLCTFPEVARIPGKVLFSLFLPLGQELLTIETTNDFTFLYLFISLSTWKHKYKVVGGCDSH